MDKILKQDTVDKICQSLERHGSQWNWYADRCYLQYKDTRLFLNVSGGFYVDRPSKITFTFWQRRKLRKAFRRWRKEIGCSKAEIEVFNTCHFIITTLTA